MLEFMIGIRPARTMWYTSQAGNVVRENISIEKTRALQSVNIDEKQEACEKNSQ